MSEAKTDPRPLSPHLQIWKFTPTLAASITHRGTGIALYSGSLFLTVWLVAAAIGPDAFAPVQALYGSPIGLLALFAYTWAVSFHLMNGLRHLFWDAGSGLAPQFASATAVFIYLASVGLAIAVWVAGFAMKGAL